jgi:hypothetical protein
VQTISKGSCAAAIHKRVQESKNPGVKDPPGIQKSINGLLTGFGATPNGFEGRVLNFIIILYLF